MATTGTATIDFGAFPPTDFATVAVTGQGSIIATSQVEVWIMGSTTTDNDEEDHMMAQHYMEVVPSIPRAGDGFDIYAFVLQGRTTGTYKLQWVWN